MLEAQVADVDVKLSVTDLSGGDLYVYTTMVNNKVLYRQGTELGLKGQLHTLSHVPSPVNFHNAFHFSAAPPPSGSADELDSQLELAFEDPANYKSEKGDYSVYILVVNKATAPG